MKGFSNQLLNEDRRLREALHVEIGQLRLVYEQLKVDISALEQQKCALAATIKRMGYKKRPWLIRKLFNR